MAWYAYCLTEQASLSSIKARRPYPVEGLRGINGAQVLAFPSGDLAVVVSEYLRTTMNERSAYEHARVIGECFRHGTVLPLRFGTVFDTEDGLRQAIRANRKIFLDTVATLRGKSEMHLKVTVRDPEIKTDTELPSTAGSEYLEKLRQKATRDREYQTRARAVSMQVHKLFTPLQEEVVCKRVPSGALLLEIAHLIDSQSVPKYQIRYSTALKQLRNCEVAISGPWPPYRFMPEKIRTVSEN